MLSKGKRLATKVVKEVPVPEALKKQAAKVQAQWRKIVTGNANKRIRDHLKEAQQQPQYVKFFDKVAFTFGVLNIVFCQYFLLNVPEYFSIWYSVVVPLLMISRLYHFKSLNWHYFMFDFCYFVLACTLINISLLRWSTTFFKICFIFATGALPAAIPIWRNSLIFHDYDKIVSVYIHILPCCLYYTLRWSRDHVNMQCLSNDCSSLTFGDYLWSMVVYLLWQVLYILKTEVWDRSKLDSNPEILTSLRWMAKDTKNASARMVLKYLKQVGLFGPQEDYDSTSLKTKAVFVASQLALTAVSSLPSFLLYRSQWAHITFILIIFTIAVFNGASFYIEVFAVRYVAHLAQLDQMRTIARAASEVAKEIDEMTAAVKAEANAKGSNNGSTATTEEAMALKNDLRRTEEAVWREMRAQTRSFYACASPVFPPQTISDTPVDEDLSLCAAAVEEVENVSEEEEEEEEEENGNDANDEAPLLEGTTSVEVADDTSSLGFGAEDVDT